MGEALVLNRIAGKTCLIPWLQELGLIRRERQCGVCGGSTHLKRRNGSPYTWVCRNRGHYWSERLTSGTIFHCSQLTLGRALTVAYLFAHGITNVNVLAFESSRQGKLTPSRTVSRWLSLLRRGISLFAAKRLSRKIGGSGKVVDVDEAFLGWTNRRMVVGMMEREVGPDGRPRAGRLRLVPIPKSKCHRTEMVRVVRRHVLHGTTVVTGGRAAYARLSTLGEDPLLWRLKGREPYYRHQVVTHRLGSVARKNAKIHVQVCGPVWKCIKQPLSGGGNRRGRLRQYLYEQIWRRNVRRHGLDPFDEIVGLLAEAGGKVFERPRVRGRGRVPSSRPERNDQTCPATPGRHRAQERVQGKKRAASLNDCKAGRPKVSRMGPAQQLPVCTVPLSGKHNGPAATPVSRIGPEQKLPVCTMPLSGKQNESPAATPVSRIGPEQKLPVCAVPFRGRQNEGPAAAAVDATPPKVVVSAELPSIVQHFGFVPCVQPSCVGQSQVLRGVQLQSPRVHPQVSGFLTWQPQVLTTQQPFVIPPTSQVL
ncbi:uncharacterized protein LOC135370117 [Ornithodoros turicata]|uniref:uncharacterized protein LOC135370117 n=1 Tax=Ornithodoros turicata TaxID=34597 RepID=UPI00313A1C64